MKKLFLASLLLINVNAFAAGGDRIGNGGDVVICGDKVELLDIYEAKRSGFNFINLKSTGHNEMLTEVLNNRLAPLQPTKASRYTKNFQDLPNEAQMLSGIHLNDIDDAGLVAIPKNCTLEQIVVQLKEEDIPEGGKRYTFNSDLWEKLDEFNKTALLLHEIIYREAIEKDSASSMVVRAMVGQLLKDQMDLQVYFNLDFVLNNKKGIEFHKYLLTFARNLKPILKIETNEYGEECVTFNGGTKSETLSSTFRLIDGQLLLLLYKSGRYDKFVRANQTYKVSDRIEVTPNKGVFFAGNTLESNSDSPPNFKIDFITNNGVRSFNIISATYLDIMGDGLQGEFAIQSEEINMKFGNNSFILDMTSGELSQYNFVDYQQFKNAVGSFNCKRISRNNYNPDTAQYENKFYPRYCQQSGTFFKASLSISNRKIDFPGTILEDGSANLDLSNSGELLPDSRSSFRVTNDVYLGKTKGVIKKDIILKPDSYSFYLSNIGVLTIRSTTTNTAYDIYYDGTIDVYRM